MAKGINHIPYHCFKIHDICGSWCRYHKNPDTYKHSVLRNGFHDESLFEELKIIFEALAKKCHQFVTGVSSNLNESLNLMIVSKAPKIRFYGLSSGNARVACAVIKKMKEKFLFPK